MLAEKSFALVKHVCIRINGQLVYRVYTETYTVPHQDDHLRALHGLHNTGKWLPISRRNLE